MRNSKPANHGRKLAWLPALSLALALSACSSGGNRPSGRAEGGSGAASPPSVSRPSAGQGAQAPGQARASGATRPASSRVIGLEGLGDLRIGQPVPEGTSWAVRGAQAGDACRTVSSPAYPGVYGLVVEGKVQRITVGRRSDVTLVEGIGAGAAETEVRQWFAGFREEPHKYESAPAKYLTAPNASTGGSALRFEIGQDRKVNFIHVGIMPVLAFVEGCA